MPVVKEDPIWEFLKVSMLSHNVFCFVNRKYQSTIVKSKFANKVIQGLVLFMKVGFMNAYYKKTGWAI